MEGQGNPAVANTITAFLETLVAASGDYNAAKVGKLSFLDSVYMDVKPEAARAGQTINVFFPDMGAWTDQAANDWTPSDVDPNYVPVVFNQRPGKGILIRDFEQWQTATDIVKNFYDPMYKRGLEYFNGQVAAQVTTGNFNAYTPITSSAPGTLKRADINRGWNLLAGNSVPVDNPNDLAILTHNDIYTQMLNDADWTQESIASAQAAQLAREQGEIVASNKFRKAWDQQAPAVKTALAGTVTVTSGSANVSGSGTSFTTALTVGDTVYFGADGTYTPYRVLTITSDTAIVLTAAYGNTTAAGTTCTKAVYTSLMMHRYSIALAVRPLQLVNDGHVQSRLVVLKGIPFRVMLSYEHSKSGYLLTMDAGCAVKVLRPDFGAIIQS